MNFCSIKECIKTQLRQTPAEVLIGAFFGVTIAVVTSWSYQSAESKLIPVGYSEIGSIEQLALMNRQEVDPITAYLTTTNDAIMDIFVANNQTYLYTDGSRQKFARELEFKYDESFKIDRYTLKERLESLPKKADAALDELIPFREAFEAVKSTNNLLDKSWSEFHLDVYRTEFYEETHVDSKGNSHSETMIRQVYDHTNHYYTYYPSAGEAASKSLDDLTQEYGKIRFNGKNLVTNKTTSDNEYAAELSRKGKKLEPEALLNIANMWSSGSTFFQNLPQVYDSLSDLESDAQEWRSDKNTARNVSYRTNSTSDKGPVEFQTVKNALYHGRSLESSLDNLIKPIKHTKTAALELEDKVEQFIAVELDGSPGNGNKLSKEIMNSAQELYSENFEYGFDVTPFSVKSIVLWGLAGLAAGTAVGVIWDLLGNKLSWYNIKEPLLPPRRKL
jgi:hypothetical protein